MVKQILFFASAILFTPLSLHSAPSEHPGRVYQSELSAQELYSLGLQAIEEERWGDAQQRLWSVIAHHPESAFACEARYFLGLSLFHLNRLEEARQQFAEYLQRDRNPKHFESVFAHKLQIANRYAQGERRNLFHSRRLPRWRSGKSDALELFDEVIVTLPSHALAAEALAAKGALLGDMGEYVEAIENFTILIARFPKHPRMPEGYLAISDLYLKLSRNQKHDPDLLALAHINLRKFRHDFPTDRRVEVAESHFQAMRGVYAEGLYETGRFYERKKKPSSAAVYYRAAIRDYPDSHSAELSRERMAQLGMVVPS